ncbi:methyl-accepting chemotaxis protein [Hydrogenophaga aquatica]
MRLNLPVTSREYPFPKGRTLVSTTDSKGRILYCNPMFIEVSGYTREELLGQPHNLIRHPDMPEEAFRDLWDTIASGRPWSGLVKNRRKNGDHYWVMANVTPLMHDGVPAGYMSVRTEASQAQIQAAESLYARMRAEETSGHLVHRLKAGRVVRATWWGRLRERMRLGLEWRLLLVLATTGLLGYAISLVDHDPSFVRQALAGGMIVCGIAAAWRYLSYLMLRPVGQLVAAANRMAGADMTQPVEKTRDDDFGQMQQAMAQLNVNLMSVVRDARQQSQEMARATTEIAQGNLDLSQRTEAQASSLEQTAASLTQITETVRQTVDSTRQANAMATAVNETVQRGSEAVEALGGTMREIQASSARIGDITQVIDGIAFQTNILALNAAVEAARAGDQGRGFAVVASEVRSLAQRVSLAAREIKDLIDESTSKVNDGEARTQAVQSVMGQTVDGVRKVNDIVTEISHAAEEQLAGLSQINAAVSQMDGITQQNAALVEQLANAASSLEGMARNVTETVQVFRLESAQHAPLLPDAVALRAANKRSLQLAA